MFRANQTAYTSNILERFLGERRELRKQNTASSSTRGKTKASVVATEVSPRLKRRRLRKRRRLASVSIGGAGFKTGWA